MWSCPTLTSINRIGYDVISLFWFAASALNFCSIARSTGDPQNVFSVRRIKKFWTIWSINRWKRFIISTYLIQNSADLPCKLCLVLLDNRMYIFITPFMSSFSFSLQRSGSEVSEDVNLISVQGAHDIIEL